MNRYAALTLALLGILCLPSLAQNDPDLEQGMHPYGSYHGGDIDSVSLTNGSLILHIPLVSYPQRGKLSLSFSLTLSNKNWKVHQWTDAGIVYDQWQWAGSQGVVPIWEQALGFSTHYDSTTDVESYYLNTADGASHQTGFLNTYPLGYRETLDATGYQTYSSGTTRNAIDKNGIRFFSDTTSLFVTLEDPNGNKITTSASGWTDALGRVIPGSTTDVYGYSDVLAPGVNVTIPSSCPVGSTAAREWDLPGPTGTSKMIFCYSDYSFTSNFHWQNFLEGSVSGQRLLHQIVLPDQSMWIFDYDGQGSLSKVTFPTGGTLSYTYENGPAICSKQPPSPPISLWVKTRTLNDGTGPKTWNYSWSGSATVTDPLGNDVVHTFDGVGGPSCSSYETQTQYYSGSSSTGTLLKTVGTTYSGMLNPYNGYTADPPNAIEVAPSTITTTWANGKTSQVVKVYDSGTTFTVPDAGTGLGPFPLTFGDVATATESDFGQGTAGPVLRQTLNTYQWQVNGNYKTNNILDLVSSRVTENGAGYKCAEMDYGYDDTSRLLGSGITTQHVGPPGNVRGNLSSIGRWISANPCQSGASGSLTYSYQNTYDTGMVYQSIDPLGNATTHSYSSTFAGAYVTQTQYPDTSSPNLAHHSISGNYDFNSGLLTSFTDQNGKISTYGYDSMLRFTTANFPDGGSTTFIYHSPTLLERQQKIDSTRVTDTYVQFDGVGRETRRATASDEPTAWDEVDTCYDARGLKAFVSYPYQNPSGFNSSPICSGAGDSFAYDALRRVIQVTHSDGSAVVTSYAGAATSVTDEGTGSGNIQRISQTDGVGRLTAVCEVTNKTLTVGIAGSTTPSACGLDIAATGFLTNYQYDGLSNLLSVSQGPLNQRTFSYDSLSRLTSAHNPESGTTTYAYTRGASFCSGDLTSVCFRSDALGKSTTYTYDQLNRLRSKGYSDSTPPVTINYDEGAAFGVTLATTTGRKSSEYTGATATTGSVFSYDTMGRIVNNSQCTPQNCGSSTFPVTYTYDYVGDQTAATNGAGVTLTYAYNRAQRLTALTSNLSDANHPGTLLSGAHYNAFGMMTSAPLGNTLTESRTATARGWLQSLNVTIPDSSKNTPSTATVTVQGSEQSTVVPATPGKGSVTIGGAEQCQCQPNGPTYEKPLVSNGRQHYLECPQGYHQICDAGTITVTVNGHADTVNYNVSSTTTSLVAALASGINADTGAFVNATANGSVLNLTARTTGSGTNYTLSASRQTNDPDDFPSGSFTVSTSGANLTGGANAYTVYDSGTVSLTVNGSDQKTVNYAQGSTTSTVASALASAFTGDSLIAVTANGSTLTLTSIAKGQSTNYSLSYSHTTSQGQYFSQPSFTATGPGAMTGGTNGYDTLYSLAMGYAPDGDVTSGNDSVNGNWTYTYDDFNRLATAAQPGQGCAYVYDRFGNRWQQNVTQGTCPSPQFTFDANNRISTGPYAYDAAGNLTNDGTHTYAYDAENRITMVDGGTTATYVYDADGRRVRKTSSGGTVDFVYDLGGRVVSQVTSGGTWTRGEVFAGARHFVTYANGTGGTTLFTHGDWLGTERMRTGVTGIVAETFTNLAFGDALNQVGSSPLHLTSKERDNESNLDYFGARYYSSGMGRWLSADWSAQPAAVPYVSLNLPQSLNLYTYVENNPIGQVDAQGHAVADNTSSTSTVSGMCDPSRGSGGCDIVVNDGALAQELAMSDSEASQQEIEAGSVALQELNALDHTMNKIDPTGITFLGVGELEVVGEGATILENAAKGAASEARVLDELGVVKNTEKLAGAEGKSIPDFQTSKTVGEIKDTKNVSNTQQIRIQKEAAQASGRQHELYTGKNTHVTQNAAQGTRVIRRDDLGPR